MIIGKNFFIIEIPKTGTSFLRNYFRKYQNVLITTHHDTIEHNPKFNLLKKKYTLCLPCIEKVESFLVFKRWDLETEMKVGKFKINEPNNKLFEEPSKILVPLLAFDSNNYRLGYGGGFYDRTFANLKELNFNFYSVGFAFDDQKQEKLPKEIFDYKLDFVLTEKELYKFI